MVWLILPTYDEAGNVERVVGRHCSARARGPRRAPRSSSSTTTPPTGRGRSPTALAAELARPSRSCTARAARGSGPPTSPASTSRCAAARRSCSRWTPTSPTTRPTSCASSRPRGTPTSCSARATCAGGGVRDWGPVRRIVSRARLLVRAGGARRCASSDLTGGFKCFRREVLEAIDLAHARSHGYVFQVELTYRAAQAGLPHPGGPDHVPRPRGGALEDVVADRARGRRPRAAPALGAPRARARRADARAVRHALTGLRPRGPRGRSPGPHAISTISRSSRAAPRPARRCVAGTPRPGRCSAAGWPGSLADRRRAAALGARARRAA